MKEASVCIIQNENKEYLFLKRNYAPLGWCLPGGKIEPGETPLRALRREILEETGVFLFEATFLRKDTAQDGSTVHVFSAKITGSGIVLSPEHSAFIWTKEQPTFELAGNTKSFISDIKLKRPKGIVCKPLSDEIFWYGKYKDKTYVEVANIDPRYIFWIKNNTQHTFHTSILALAQGVLAHEKEEKRIKNKSRNTVSSRYDWRNQERQEGNSSITVDIESTGLLGANDPNRVVIMEFTGGLFDHNIDMGGMSSRDSSCDDEDYWQFTNDVNF